MAKTITFAIPEELHKALLLKQSSLHVDSKDGKKTPLSILVPKLLAKSLNMKLPEGWDAKRKKETTDE